MNDVNKKFIGTGVALVTPFHRQGTIDFSSLEALIEHVVGGGIDYIVLLGTTGEAVTLSYKEKTALISFVKETVNKRVPIVLGVGSNNTQDIINQLQTLDFEDIDAVMSVTPYYNKPTKRGLLLHYKQIACASSKPIILYNVPGRTGINMTSDIVLELAHQFDNVIGVKEASGNLTQIFEIIKNKPDDFLVISGDDMLTLPILAAGGHGVISVIANAYPKTFVNLVRYGLKGDFIETRKLHFMLMPMINAIFADGSPGGIKAALEQLELIQNNLRLPIVKVNKSINYLISTLVAELKSNGIEN